MAAASIIVSLIPMRFYIYHCPLLYLEITILEEKSVLFPSWDLDVASEIYRTAPGIVADRTSDHPVHQYFLTFNFNKLGLDGWVAILQRVRWGQISDRFWRTAGADAARQDQDYGNPYDPG